MLCVDMGWLWLVGSLKIQVAFAEYSLFYRALLQKRPVFLGSLRIVASSYVVCWCVVKRCWHAECLGVCCGVWACIGVSTCRHVFVSWCVVKRCWHAECLGEYCAGVTHQHTKACWHVVLCVPCVNMSCHVYIYIFICMEITSCQDMTYQDLISWDVDTKHTQDTRHTRHTTHTTSCLNMTWDVDTRHTQDTRHTRHTTHNLIERNPPPRGGFFRSILMS